MKKKLPNLLGAIVRDYFTDHLPVFAEPVHTPSKVTATVLCCFCGFSRRTGIDPWRNST